MRTFLLTLLLSGTAAAQTPTVKYVQPNLVKAEGSLRRFGFAIYFQNAKLPQCRIDFCGGTLTVGGQAIAPDNVFLSESTVGAWFANDFPPGPADVVLRLPDRTITVPNAVTFVADADYETILLPHTPGNPLPGANGSRWRVEMLLRNDSPYSVMLEVPMFEYTLISPPPPDWFVVPPQTTANVHVYTDGGPLRVRLPKIAVKDLVVQTRFYDDARLGTNFGTRVPTVREHDFRRGTTTLPDVPTGSGFRSTVRVFGPDGVRRVFRVRVLTQPLLETGPWLTPPIDPVPASEIAAYEVQTEDTGDPVKQGGPWSVTLASLAIPAFPGHERVQIRIEPVDAPDAPYWAYVSVTNNETQQVTLLTP
ncbi:MAG TPA: hypothetical protein VM733_03050 [Thermoanaerobaculia bacterium]|nr:hypothetical protein [Thermoanaerobaculia bacterium]